MLSVDRIGQYVSFSESGHFLPLSLFYNFLKHNTMALDFQKYAAEGNAFVKNLARQLNCPDDNERASRVLRSVLHAVRDMITPQESLQFLAQLPMFLKAVYVDGWTFTSSRSKIKDAQDLFARMREYDRPVAFHDFPGKGLEERAVITVFSQLHQYVTPGEFEDIVSQVPKDVKPLIRMATEEV